MSDENRYFALSIMADGNILVTFAKPVTCFEFTPEMARTMAHQFWGSPRGYGSYDP